MANYNAWIRTNCFSVTDEERFKTIMSACQAEDTVVVFEEKQPDGIMKFGFCCSGRIYGLPGENGENDVYPFYKALQEVLPESEAIIITEVGLEKMRYLIGCCTVVTKNDLQGMNLDNKALELARRMLGNPEYGLPKITMNRERIDFLKRNYQPGVSIRLISMSREPQMTPGMTGKVLHVDDIGQIHTRWSNGSSLALNCEIDEFVAFSGPDAGEYLHEKLGLTEDAKIWYLQNPLRFQFTAVDTATLIEAAERYMNSNVEITKDLAVTMCKPYDTVTLLDAFISAHVLSDEDARQIRLKKDFSASDSDQYHCPKCGADNLNYGQTKLEDEFVVCPWECRKCGSTGKEYGSIVFDGHCVETSPDFTEVQK